MREAGRQSGGSRVTQVLLRSARPAASDEGTTRAARVRGWLASPGRKAAVWVVMFAALLAILTRISFGLAVNSDAANSMLQARAMLNGNLLLHGWIVSDVSNYTFELPLYAITERLFGMRNFVPHVDSAIIYLTVAACAIALARANSRGLSSWVRTGVVLAVLSAPLLTTSGISIVLERPGHTGAAVIMLACFLLIDRRLGWRGTPVLVLVLLTVGQLGDATVVFVAGPAIVLVSVYRAVRARRIFTGDAGVAVAAVLSVPLEMLIRHWMLAAGAFREHSPHDKIAPLGELGHHAALTLHAIRVLFGDVAAPGRYRAGMFGVILGALCIAAVLIGLGRVIWTWLRASRAEQLLCLASIINVCAYMFSAIPTATNARELQALIPFGAVLAARAVPATVKRSRFQVRAAVAVCAAAGALVALAYATPLPAEPPPTVRLATWLEAHGLDYGIGGYWNASSVTLQSGGRVMVRAVKPVNHGVGALGWEVRPSWYSPAGHYATFAIASALGPKTVDNIPPSVFESRFGWPSSVHVIDDWVILVYQQNLLNLVKPVVTTHLSQISW